MADYAIIKASGKQYKVSVGDKIELELLKEEAGKEVTFETLLTSKKDKVSIGAPLLKSVVTATVLEPIVKGEKIHIRQFKAKSRHRRHIGHRQKYTLVEIKSI